MKIVFIQRDTFAKTSIMALSAVVKKAGHECDVVITCLEKDPVKAALEAEPDIIAFSINIYEVPWMASIGPLLRQSFAGPIICGGPHPTFLPELTIREPYLDAICLGEGEEAIIDYINAIAGGTDTASIPNIYSKRGNEIFRNDLRPLIEDLDSLPFWDRAIYDKYPVFRVSHGGVMYHFAIMTSRGCLYDCTFCINSAYKKMCQDKGTFFRRRSVSSVIEELKSMKRHYPKIKQIDFEDDSFMLPPREWVSDFMARYATEIKIPFQMQTSANLLNEELVGKLKKANCHTVSMGIESGNEEFRRNIFNKHVSNSQIRDAAFLVRKQGIRFQTFNIIGCPGETLDMAMETYELNKEIRPDLTRCTFFHPYPGTQLYHRAVAEGLIDEDRYYREIGHHSAFIGTLPELNPGPEMLRLQQLMGPGVMLRWPGWLVRSLVKVPLGRIYRILLALSFLVGFYRINSVSLPYFLRLSFTSYASDVLRD